MLDLEISLFIYMIEMLIAHSVFSRLGPRLRSLGLTLLAGAGIFASGAAVNMLFSNTVWINASYTLAMNFLFAASCYKIKLKTILIYSVLMDLLSTTFEFITIFFVSSLIGADITSYNSDALLLAIESGVSKLLYFVACILLIRPISGVQAEQPHIPFSFFLYPFSTLLVLLVFWYICEHEDLDASHKLLLSQTSLVLLTATIVLHMTYRRSIEKDSELSMVKNENRLLQTEKAHYDLMKHQNDQLMIYAHDAKKHLSAIQGLNKDPAIELYLEKLLDQLKEHSKTCQSGNKILDVMINKYAGQCQMLGVQLAVDVRSCCLGDVDEIDLVAILGNLMDNAIAAAAASEEKWISLETTVRNNYDVIVITNSCDIPPVAVSGDLVTTKADKQAHGYGIKSVRKALKKYCGDMDHDYDQDTRTFTATVMIGKKKAGLVIRKKPLL